jgi:glutathione peroxidase
MAEEKDDVAGETLAWAFSFPSIGGGRLDFASFRGRVLLVANTASFCGYTYQYEGLENLHAAKAAAGLTVVGVPSQGCSTLDTDEL